MQIKIFTVPLFEGKEELDALNAFLRGNKVLTIDKQLIQEEGRSAWTFCVSFLEQRSNLPQKGKKIDYKHVLDDASFKRFSQLREIRRKLAKDEGIPAFAIFTDEELAGLAVHDQLSLAVMKEVKGIGNKKVEKFGKHFIVKNEASQ